MGWWRSNVPSPPTLTWHLLLPIWNFTFWHLLEIRISFCSHGICFFQSEIWFLTISEYKQLCNWLSTCCQPCKSLLHFSSKKRVEIKKKKPVSGIIDKNYTKRANLANLSGMSHPWWPIFLVWKQYLISLENIFLFVPFEPEIFSSMAFRTSNSLFFTWHFAFSILNSHFSAWHFAEGIFVFFLSPFFPFNFYLSIFRKKVLPKR